MSHSILLTSVEFERMGTCRGCRRPVMWARTAKGKNIALEPKAPVRKLGDYSFEVSTDFVHWATCPSADAHRRAATRRPSEAID